MHVLTLLLTIAVAFAGTALDDKKPKISLKANPAMGVSPVRVVVTADITGGANDNEELYCAAVEWQWGDETRSINNADCDPYEAGKSQIKRRFTADHVYRTSGEYRVMFILKKGGKTVGAGNTAVRVRPGLGDGDDR